MADHKKTAAAAGVGAAAGSAAAGGYYPAKGASLRYKITRLSGGSRGRGVVDAAKQAKKMYKMGGTKPMAVGGAVAGASLGALALSGTKKKVEKVAKSDPFNVEKSKKLKKEPSYTRGRAVAATALGAYHAPFAAKKGKKLRSTGRVVGEGFAGSFGGGALGSMAGLAATRGRSAAAPTVGAHLGSTAGVIGGTYHGFRENNKRGYYKKQVSKSDTTSAFGVDHS